ncbi:PREDICTED: elongation factor 1-beta [Cyprinodon variegatus]|uniref:Elongation factor 1-beta n=1 Tax=Cyprinodon variegatus TaxID=28743 RepID=A0A3Q2EGB0_CYPVA|nr:PREDICTED: elongation factor 1-beta [Cyprinodon variegatus]
MAALWARRPLSNMTSGAQSLGRPCRSPRGRAGGGGGRAGGGGRGGVSEAYKSSSLLRLLPSSSRGSFCLLLRFFGSAMGFGDLKSASGLKVLNDFLSERSYIEGFVPSQADVAVFEVLSAAPPADLNHALRWYNHIRSYQNQKTSLPGVKKPLGQYGPPGVADTTSGSASKDDDDDDIDLFGSDEEEDAEAAKLKEQRLAEYAAKKAKKPALIAKSSLLLDVKPWDDETDMAKLEECVRSIEMDGLVWGQSKLVPVGYGIKKLQISCVVEDEKVGTDILEEKITAFEDHVQSMDVAAFNKI